MLQNVYSLPDLIDLALKVPEVGAVNFNLLHIVLHTIVKESKLTDIRPWCHIENPLLAKIGETKAMLLGVQHSRVVSADDASRTTDVVFKHIGSTRTATASEKDVEKSRKSASKPSEDISEEPSSEDVHPTFERKDSAIQTEDVASEVSKVSTSEAKKESVSQDAPSYDKRKDLEDLYLTLPTKSPDKEKIPQPVRPRRAQDAWDSANIKARVGATEEGLQRLSNIVDLLAGKVTKSEKRKQEGGPASEELEAIDDRILELEEAMARMLEDHELLMQMSDRLNTLMKEFEEIKALGALLEQMRIDIEKKADREEMMEILNTKASVDLVNTKVDRLEFETAIEELGEAIGMLGLKFLRKNDEWEERADEIWKAIHTKMTRDIFEEARIKTESRITALMYALRKMKKVIEDLLYPEASGVTRCILCRRPACIAGIECIGISDSPKRVLSDKSSGDEEPKKLKKTLGDTISKRRKLAEPPYCEDQGIIFKLPYSSSSYRTSIDREKSPEPTQMKLMPITSDSKFDTTKKTSKVPKLPDINDSNTRSTDRKNIPVIRSKAKHGTQRTELRFSKELLASFEKKKPSSDQKSRFTAVLEEEPSEKESSNTSPKSAVSVVLTPDPTETMNEFTPSRLMLDTQRRDILLSPTSPKEGKLGITLSPLQFDTKSI